MGKLMLYGAGRACQSLACLSPGSNGTNVTAFKDKDGNSRNALAYGTGTNSTQYNKNTGYFRDLTGYISADTIEDFDLTDYTTNAIANVSSSSSSAQSGTNGRIYTITATNNNTEAIIVASIKFTKTIAYFYSNSFGDCTALICGYFLDTPVTIEAGATKTFAVNIDCWNY